MIRYLTFALAATLFYSIAHAQQGNLPTPVQKLPAYPPVVCVAPNWATYFTEPCWSAALTKCAYEQARNAARQRAAMNGRRHPLANSSDLKLTKRIEP